jgi:hypothetical protein
VGKRGLLILCITKEPCNKSVKNHKHLLSLPWLKYTVLIQIMKNLAWICVKTATNAINGWMNIIFIPV